MVKSVQQQARKALEADHWGEKGRKQEAELRDWARVLLEMLEVVPPEPNDAEDPSEEEDSDEEEEDEEAEGA